MALVKPIVVAVHLQDMDMVCEAVEKRPGEALGAELFWASKGSSLGGYG